MRFLIIGQGLAGTLLGYRLEEAGHTVHYVDAPEQTAASEVAAGIVNPITGRRFVKSWRIEDLLPEVHRTYGQLESLLGVRIWHPMPLIRTLYNRGDVNDWQARTADAGYPDFMEDQADPGRVPEITAPVFAYAGVRHAGRVDVDLLVRTFRDRLRAEGRFFAHTFAYAHIPALLSVPPGKEVGAAAGAGQGTMAGIGLAATYDYVVSCEGWRARHNPWFSYLPHGGNKGEVLIVRTEAPLLDRMFKHRVFIVPLADDTYWVGASSANQFPDDQPTAAQGDYLAARLAEVLTVPFTILAHRAAVRPTVRDRRMFLGQHPALPGLAIFNGLGTKGASLAPLGARWLADHLLTGKALPPEVDIQRFG